MSDFQIWDIFTMFITIYPNNFLCLFRVYEIMQLFLSNLVFILDSNPEFVHYCSFLSVASPMCLAVDQAYDQFKEDLRTTQ